jgi:hypothetical protein
VRWMTGTKRHCGLVEVDALRPLTRRKFIKRRDELPGNRPPSIFSLGLL